MEIKEYTKQGYLIPDPLNMKKSLYIFILAIFVVLPVYSADSFEVRGARPFGLSNTGVGAPVEFDAPLLNPAGVYYGDLQGLTMAYGHPVVGDSDPERDLASFGFVDSLARRSWGWGLYGLYSSSASIQNQKEIGVAFARPLWETENGEQLNFGLNLGYVSNEVAVAGVDQQKKAVSVGAGLLWILSPDFSLGLVGRDLNHPHDAVNSSHRRRATYGAGTNWRFMEKTRLSLDWLGTEAQSRTDLRAGLERSLFSEKIFVRVGSNRDAVTGGCGLRLGSLSLDYGYAYPYLKKQNDRQHVVSLAYRWSAPEPKPIEASSSDSENSPATIKASSRVNRFLEKVEGLRRRSELSVGPLDIIRVRVKDHPELETISRVDSWGFVELPFVKELKVDGLKIDEIEKRLSAIYQGFVLSPQVSVMISSHSSRVVYVFGQVQNPGKISLGDSKVTLRDVLVEAGLPTVRSASWRTFVIRQTETGPIYYRVNAARVLYRGILDNNVVLQSGDVVYVPMGILDSLVTFIGRLVSPLTGAASTAVRGGQ